MTVPGSGGPADTIFAFEVLSVADFSFSYCLPFFYLFDYICYFVHSGLRRAGVWVDGWICNCQRSKLCFLYLLIRVLFTDKLSKCCASVPHPAISCTHWSCLGVLCTHCSEARPQRWKTSPSKGHLGGLHILRQEFPIYFPSLKQHSRGITFAGASQTRVILMYKW